MVVNTTYDGAVAVTVAAGPTMDPAGPFSGLLVIAAGTVAWIDSMGNASGTTGSLAAGTVIPVKVVRVTGGTATVLGLKSVA
jgi:hypothetical protein